MKFLENSLKNRREILVMFASAGAFMIVGCHGDNSTGSDGTSNCIVTPQLTEGPYFVDEHLNRSNIVGGQPGLSLGLNIKVYDASSAACSPFAGIQVDVWHANAIGIYSDEANLGSGGKTFLRGYQRTGTDGIASFTTIYPGWYTGRTTHIHVKARMFNAVGTQTLEATTQLFFEDSVSDGVYANSAPYNTRGPRDTKNSQDSIYGGQTSLFVPLSGSTTSGYTGSISIGISA
jgi:protocatechuate 3,4-dioxygenase beta subunit